MSSAQRSLVACSVEWILQRSLRVWPQESKEWGRAMAAEAAEINDSVEALRWALGGLLFFFRSLGWHFLAWTRLPAGGNFPAFLNGGEPPPRPKHSRLTTALLLMGAMLLLLVPWGREAVSGVWGNWRSLALESQDLEPFIERAEIDHDARKLAFAGISHPDPARGMRLAGKAVALDPSLVWIYASRFARTEPDRLPADWLTQLQAHDPDNGYVYLLAANCRAQPLFSALVYNHSPSDDEIEKTLASDPEWLSLMQRAVAAPRYDGYSQRHGDLSREIWSREPSLSPGVVTYSLWAALIPDPLFVDAYRKLRIRQPQRAQARGDWQQA